MPLTANDIIRVTPQLKAPGVQTRVQNVFWYQCTEVISQVFADIRADFAAELATIYNHIGPYQSSVVVAEGFKLVDVTQKETYGKPTWTYDGNEVGPDSLPPQVCAEVLAYTFESGRYGRKYLGPFLEMNCTDGLWDALMITALEAFASEWSSGFTGSVTGNSYISGVARKVGGVYQFKQFAAALGVYAEPYARTQRRRTAGFGLS